MLLLLLVLSRCSRVRLCATPETTAHGRGLKLREYWLRLEEEPEEGHPVPLSWVWLPPTKLRGQCSPILPPPEQVWKLRLVRARVSRWKPKSCHTAATSGGPTLGYWQLSQAPPATPLR